MDLIKPDKKYLKSFLEACIEYKDNKVQTFSLPDPNLFDDWKELIFDNYHNNSLGINLKEGYVPSTTYWMVDEDKWYGEIDIRHSLTKSLLNYGGHIGYCVRFSLWGKGVGTEMLKQALVNAKKMGLNKVLITCNDDNIGSAKVIEKNGGVLENKIKNIIDGNEITTRRYWISL